jgi:hypothetical protein
MAAGVMRHEHIALMQREQCSEMRCRDLIIRQARHG